MLNLGGNSGKIFAVSENVSIHWLFIPRGKDNSGEIGQNLD